MSNESPHPDAGHQTPSSIIPQSSEGNNNPISSLSKYLPSVIQSASDISKCAQSFSEITSSASKTARSLSEATSSLSKSASLLSEAISSSKDHIKYLDEIDNDNNAGVGLAEEAATWPWNEQKDESKINDNINNGSNEPAGQVTKPPHEGPEPDSHPINSNDQPTNTPPKSPASRKSRRSRSRSSSSKRNNSEGAKETPQKRKHSRGPESEDDASSERSSKKSRGSSPPTRLVSPDPKSYDDEQDNSEKYWNREPLSPLREDDKKSWPGFREVESDSNTFSAQLHLLGVKGVIVRDVLSLDNDDLMFLAPILGFIFCFPSRVEDRSNQVKCPDGVWFANQTHRNLCGSNALLNILMNTDDVDLGEHLTHFKEYSQQLSTAQRGVAVGNFPFLRRVHNVSLRKMEILVGDVKQVDSWRAGKEKTAKPYEPPPSPTLKPRDTDAKGKKKAAGKPVKTFSGGAQHYAAYLPIQGHIWKLDGMDNYPSRLDAYDERPWLLTAADILRDFMDEIKGVEQYNILAVCLDDESAEEAAPQEKALYDYEPIVRTWLEMLKGQEDVLSDLIDSVRTKGKGAGRR